MKNINQIIQNMRPISLEEMDAVRLMSRTDTKYVFHAGLLPGLLEDASNEYRILTIENVRHFRYNSLYFDNDRLDFYLQHHNGDRPRFKVRFREYEDTGAAFLEVKHKTNRDRTRKSRQRVNAIEKVLSDGSWEYIENRIPFDPGSLKPALWTRFKRITLTGSRGNQRITIDTDLQFSNEAEEISLPNLVICEVKRSRAAGRSDFMKLLKHHGIFPSNLSKYCLGTVMVKKHIKYNRFKSNILKINKLENDYRSYIAAG